VNVKIVLPSSLQSQLESRKVVKEPIEVIYDVETHGIFDKYLAFK
jgi:hypothetical protein